uniref:Tudor domain-containing protein n=1 Tax=Caenorhabditis tropicalis TaxID=1561998 RepID=A0A1I7UZF6_9PELO
MPIIVAPWNQSEIEKPADSRDSFQSFGPSPYFDPSQPLSDVYTSMGIICQDGKWYQTKYTRVIYEDTETGSNNIPVDGLQGKKSGIQIFGCTD